MQNLRLIVALKKAHFCFVEQIERVRDQNHQFYDKADN